MLTNYDIAYSTASFIIDSIPQEHRDFVQKLLADAGIDWQVQPGRAGGVN